MTTPITVEVLIDAPRTKVWEYFTKPEHITQWNAASEDWHTPRAENDVRVGGVFMSRMEAKDGSQGFDFSGTYTEVVPGGSFAYVMEDGRRVSVRFEERGDQTLVTETFDPETENPSEMQRAGWQAILENFKTYTQTH